MKIAMSYEMRGARISENVSVPEPTVDNLTKIISKMAWVSAQAVPEIKVTYEQN